MDGLSRDRARVPTVASTDGKSSIENGGKEIPTEKHSALQEASEQADNVDGSSEDGKFVDFSKPISLVVKKGLQKCATFPPSTDEAWQEDSCCDTKDVRKGALTYQRSVSLPPTTKLISAMKGSRQKNGMASPSENRHIKWAPDVYDPPVTSVCHSVNNGYQRRSNSRKKDKYKQKQRQKQKGRSKKKHNNGVQNQVVQHILGLNDGGTSSDGSIPDDIDKHEILDYGISNQEAKCGSSFLGETIPKMHFSAAEAS